jgi:hypothetical protein
VLVFRRRADYARRVVRAPVSAAVMLIGLALGAGPAGAATLSPTPIPLTGSNFQGGDGDQADTPLYDDWASRQLAGKVTRAPDDNVRDTAFSSGTELYPGSWRLGTVDGGVSPAQSNILDVWASVDEVGGNTFVYLAFSREKGTGTSFQTFELNRAGRLWTNGAGARIPCRMDGDILISFEPHGNDPNTDVEVRRWDTTDVDEDSGCAARGTLSDAVSLSVAAGIQGAANQGDITSSLPGILSGSIPPRQFGEVAINLGALFDGIRPTPCGAFTAFWMHSRASDAVDSDMKDYVEPQRIEARRCSAAGEKWLDLNADGERQGGDLPLQGFRIYADLNGNEEYDTGEPTAITDRDGHYVIDDLPATGEYTLREEPTNRVSVNVSGGDVVLAGPWTCSYPSPCNWVVDPAVEPFARGKDFGNWRPARVTLVKTLDPPDDPGRWDLAVGTSVLEGAGDGDSETFLLRPGEYLVSETAAAGTNPADYNSSVSCVGPLKRGGRRLRGTQTTINVLAGERVTCTFANTRIRIDVPSVVLDKIPPPATLTGEPLVYLVRVTNNGNVAFSADEVEVSDSRCEDLRLVERLDGAGAADGTPGSLDPGDQWTYQCEVQTSLPPDPDDCEPRQVTNRATVEVPGADDSGSAQADLLCPPKRRRAVRIIKLAPTTAVAGTPLTYRMYVGNTGEVPFTEDQVQVSDRACDAPPTIVGRFSVTGAGPVPDASPANLDPRDVWVYECTRTTTVPEPDCGPFSLDNTATVVASTPGRPDVRDRDTATTPMTCPPVPPVPPVPPQPPQPPGPPVAPEPAPESGVLGLEVPVVPRRGSAGAASLRPLRRCLRRGSAVRIRGARIATVRVLVGGRRVGGLRVRTFQRRAVIRLRRDFAPGRYRATAVVRFLPGAATPAVRLTRTVRICARRQAAPPVTG